jgi:hypothetical protein
VAAVTQTVEDRLRASVRDERDVAAPGPVGRWLTEVFNDWPEGARPPLPR